jgi:hypothetical protein
MCVFCLCEENHFTWLVFTIRNDAGLPIDNPVADANHLNATFAQNFSSFSVSQPLLSQLNEHHSASNLNTPISLAEVHKALLAQKSSRISLDNLSGLFLSKLAFSLTFPIHKIFLSLFLTANIPEL